MYLCQQFNICTKFNLILINYVPMCLILFKINYINFPKTYKFNTYYHIIILFME